MKTLAFAATVILAGSPAAATPLSDALSRHSDRDVEVLRAQRTEVGARCTLGAVYAQRGDLSRAALYLTGCDDAELPTDISAGVARIHRDLKRKLRESELAMIEVVTNPTGMTGETDALPGDTFTTPATLYLPAGDHKVKATKDGVTVTSLVRAQKHSRGAVVLEGGVKPTTKGPQPGKVDFNDNGGAVGEQHAGPPPNVKHKNMLPSKYQKGMKAVAANDNPNAIDDPLAIGETHRASRAYWLGLRLGGGMFDDGAAAARPGVAVAATGRYALTTRTFLSGRLDWSRRGGNEGTFAGVDVIAAGAGAGVTVLDSQTLGIALIAQLRGDLRLASNRTMTMTTEPVDRAGVAAAAGIEVSLPRTPFTAGLRFEQGVTALVPGARDRAILFELGVDWR
jgi:hypothetical protein